MVNHTRAVPVYRQNSSDLFPSSRPAGQFGMHDPEKGLAVGRRGWPSASMRPAPDPTSPTKLSPPISSHAEAIAMAASSPLQHTSEESPKATRVTAHAVSAKRNLRRRGILARSISAHGQFLRLPPKASRGHRLHARPRQSVSRQPQRFGQGAVREQARGADRLGVRRAAAYASIWPNHNEERPCFFGDRAGGSIEPRNISQGEKPQQCECSQFGPKFPLSAQCGEIESGRNRWRLDETLNDLFDCPCWICKIQTAEQIQGSLGVSGPPFWFRGGVFLVMTIS